MYTKKLSIRQQTKQKEKLNQQKRERTRKLILILALLIFIAVFVLLILYLFWRNRTHKNSEILTSCSTKDMSISLSPANEGPTPTPTPIDLVDLNDSIDMSSFSNIVESSIKFVNELYNMTYKDYPHANKFAFLRYLEDYAASVSPKTKDIITLIQKETTNALYMLGLEEDPNYILFSYFKIILKYSEVLYLSLKFYTNENFININNALIKHEEKFTNFKFVFQQLVLRPQLTILSRISRYFKDTIIALGQRINNTDGFKLIGKQILNLFDVLKKRIFQKFEATININRELKDIRLENIITSLETTKRLTMLNYYIIYFSLFYVSDNLMIINIDNIAFEQINRLLEISPRNTRKVVVEELKKGIILDCGNIFKELRVIESDKIDNFYNSFIQKNLKCMEQINRLAILV
eukprot:GAHX01002957.1.p1 GENE.GAHX01002957.1~~GAHX01002957.1.p1  ORF type:complete len:408 (+),score=42.78 GAHX01002957.1:312-1535(+)